LVLALLDSSRVTLAVVFGIPLAIGAVVALGVRRSTPAIALLAGSLVVAGIAVLAVWAVFRPAGPGAAAGSGAGAPPPTQGGGQPGGVSFSCTPSGTQLQEVAKGIAYQKTCLAAPAAQPFTIEFDNQDAGTPHNMHIFAGDPRSDPNARSLFSGELVTGPNKATYQVTALPAGRYFFHCDVHPTQMLGGLVVAGA
jgi:cupredoxin-like protein